MFIYTVKDIIQAIVLGGILLAVVVAFGWAAIHDGVAWIRRRFRR